MEAAPLGATALAEVRASLGSLDPAGLDAEELVRLVEQLRALASTVAAAQVRVSVAFAKARVVHAQLRGETLRHQQAAATTELALAHRISPAAMRVRLERYRRLVAEMSATLRVLASGAAGERAVLEAAKTAHSLTSDDLRALDDQIAPLIATLSPRQAEGRARRFCAQTDPQTVIRRMHHAARDAHVSCRPVADGMAPLSILSQLDMH